MHLFSPGITLLRFLGYFANKIGVKLDSAYADGEVLGKHWFQLPHRIQSLMKNSNANYVDVQIRTTIFLHNFFVFLIWISNS